MGPTCWPNLVFLIICCVGSIATDDNHELLQRLEATEQIVHRLAHRVDKLESREKIHLKRIADLESNDERHQKTIENLTKALREQCYSCNHAASMNNNMQPTNRTRTQNGAKHVPQSKINRSLPTHKERPVQRIRQAQFESPVAFFALLGGHMEHAGINQVVIFERVITNIGNGYNSLTGTFTAPTEGIYVFSATFLSFYHVNAHVSFYRNGDSINVMYLTGGEAGQDTSGSTIVLHLQKGDIITLRNTESNKSYAGNNQSSFSGFLLSSFPNDHSIVGK